jgi:hypothetical protein
MKLSNAIYHDADKARAYLEALLWADGPICPHCKVRDRASKIKGGRIRGKGVNCEIASSDSSDSISMKFANGFALFSKWNQRHKIELS